MRLFSVKQRRSPRSLFPARDRARKSATRPIRAIEACEDRTLMATALGISGVNDLIRFDTASPTNLVASTPIAGLVGGDTIVGLDFRPATGQLFALGSGSRIYTIDPNTAVATQVGADGAFTLNGNSFGFNFNPVPDRLRVTSDLDQNLRLNPANGVLAATDGTLAYAGGDPNAAANPNVVASAYTNSFGGSTATTLYDIDTNLDSLVIQNPPNNGTLNTVVGSGLGVNAVGPVGFDIQALTGGGNAAFATLSTNGSSSSLYSINLTTGASTSIGSIGGSPTLVRALAILPEVTPTATLYAINAANGNLVRINSNNPSTVVSSTPITGLVGGDTIVGLDFRPATGQLFALGSGSRLYTLNTATGAATQVGSDGAFTLNGTTFGFNFNPVPDRLRVTSTNDQNLRLNPNDGTLAATDGTLAFAVGDPNAAANPNVVASSYTNSFAGSTTTTLYDIDSNLDALVIQNPPNSGTLNTVVGAGLGINAQDVAGFDIQALPGGGNAAFAFLTIDGTSTNLYSIDLTTGAATQIGTTPVGGTAPLLLRALAVAPIGSFQLSTPTYSVGEAGGTATITVNRINGSEGVASVVLATSDGSATSPGDYTAFNQVLIFGPGVTTLTVPITIVNDAVAEGNETLNLTLSAPTGGAILGSTTTAVLTIVDNDSRPVTVNGTYTTVEDTALSVPMPGVLTGASNADGTPYQAVLVATTPNGVLNLLGDGSFTYTPNLNFNGADTFTFRADSGVNMGNVSTVTINVTPVNDAPVAVDDTYPAIVAGSPFTVSSASGLLANDTDVDNNPLTALLVSGPAHGQFTFNADGSFTYTPAASYSGPDSFTYRAYDGTATSNLATVSLTVTALNSRPTTVPSTFTTAEDTPLTVAMPGVLAGASNADGAAYTAVLVATTTHGQLSLAPDGSFAYTPDANFNGSDTFTFQAVAGANSGDVTTVTINVTPVNDAPVAGNDAFANIVAGTTFTVSPPGLLGNDTDAEGTTLSALLVTAPTHGRFTFNSDGSFLYVPDLSFSGVDSFTYRAFDGSAGSNVATATLTVIPVPMAPVAIAGDYDGDRKADVAVYLTSFGAFAIRPSGGGSDQIIAFGVPGIGQSIPAPGDYSGSGRTELGVYIPSQAVYAYRPSGGGADQTIPFGIPGEGKTIPAPGRYFGGTKTAIAAYLADFATFAIRNPDGGPDTYYPFGMAGVGQSIPAPGDYDGDGKTDLAVYLPTIGSFAYRPSSGGPDLVIPFGFGGTGGTIPSPADFDGDGKTDLAAYLPSLGSFAYRPSSGGPDVFVSFGLAGSGQTLPAPADYSGSGRAQPAVFLPGTATFASRPGGGAPDLATPFGIAGTGQSIPLTVVDQALTEITSDVSARSIGFPSTDDATLATTGKRKPKR